ncbi:hypothetical protein ACVZOT_000914 [Staphylococcus pseudintermedius]|uniref:hypothetical protein n=1 Tax=Staphylococcus pseudintermedius TaxID=283734 RepID=UPI001F552144|nr:hypothetical protein [Staphylococcus pseudintermedius]MDF0015892.1 hypothetical protein [Staphylococcus pseudintermedius]MDF0063397.1 hypothetical protein [Staphylococcus pseudintermedius]MDF0072722.1 hypothetical protein [Staphylococcus pseudintermedius]MDF0073764.1 hypothetical protein [Staphylococcus pseudintermedius]MDF0076720.1 hypothetical protein [Staphylococcus pseudintermedius]
MTSEIVSAVIGAIWAFIINKISYNKKIKGYRKVFMSPYKMELLKLPTYLERATYIVDYRGEISMDKKLEAYISQLLEETENLEGLNIKKHII